MMNQIMVIVKKDLRETLRTKAFYVSIAMVLFFMVRHQISTDEHFYLQVGMAPVNQLL